MRTITINGTCLPLPRHALGFAPDEGGGHWLETTREIEQRQRRDEPVILPDDPPEVTVTLPYAEGRCLGTLIDLAISESETRAWTSGTIPASAADLDAADLAERPWPLRERGSADAPPLAERLLQNELRRLGGRFPGASPRRREDFVLGVDDLEVQGLVAVLWETACRHLDVEVMLTPHTVRDLFRPALQRLAVVAR